MRRVQCLLTERLLPHGRSLPAPFALAQNRAQETSATPLKIHPETRIPGRGTEEMKTNEVTGRYRRGMYGMAFELGRPGVGARFHDVEKVTERSLH